MSRTEELDAVQSEMIRHNTRRQIYLFAAIGSYIYFIGDAAVNYATNDVSSVKKATTLARSAPPPADLQQELLEGAHRAGRIRLDDLHHRLEHPRLPALQEGLRLRYDYDQKVAAHNNGRRT